MYPMLAGKDGLLCLALGFGSGLGRVAYFALESVRDVWGVYDAERVLIPRHLCS
jgi:hypothetical protein